VVSAEYLGLDPSIKLVDLVTKETKDYNYIYPVTRVSHLNYCDVCETANVLPVWNNIG
jgi:hypothetical protein